MNTNATLSTNNTPKVRDGLKKDGSILITKRGYLMWLKKQHDKNPYGSIATISRYSAAECPLGVYCKEMGISIYNTPKWAQKVREFYADKMHGMTYSAMDSVYHMVELYGYKCSAIFRGDEEEYNAAALNHR
jgi:hypothetical protein